VVREQTRTGPHIKHAAVKLFCADPWLARNRHSHLFHVTQAAETARSTHV